MRDTVRTGRRLASRLDLPDPWQVDELCAQIARERKRPIFVLDRPPLEDSITATLLSTERADYIFCRGDLTGSHRDHAVCHELGHLLMEQADSTVTPGAGLGVSPTTGSRAWACVGDHSARSEQAAEAFADVIMERVSQRLGGPGDEPHRRRVINGFSDALR